MATSPEGFISLKSIRFEIDNLEESLKYYKKLGCIIDEIESTNYSISIFLRFNEKDEILIHLYKDLRRTDNLTEAEKIPTLEIVERFDLNTDDEIEVSYSKLVDTGIISLDPMPEGYFEETFHFDNSNGVNWELVDDFEYLD